MKNKPSMYKGIVLFGPTASGKTALSLRLAEALNGEVVNADSRQLYKGMTILTAAPNKEEQGDIPHHLFEILDVKEKINVTDYCAMVKTVVKDILSRGKTPIICGGTGFYLKVLFEGINEMPTVCEDLLEDLRAKFTTLGATAMLNDLKEKDPALGEKYAEGDTQRILRALGVYYQTGRPLSYYHTLPPEGALGLPFLHVSLQPEKAWLNDRIERRYTLMENAGVEAEMRQLKEQGYSLNDHGIQTLGAREFFMMFDGGMDKQSVSEEIIQQTKKYAKRQLTWARTQFKSDIILQDPCDDVNAILEKWQN